MRPVTNPNISPVDFSPRGITFPAHEKGSTRPRVTGHTPSDPVSNTVFANPTSFGDKPYFPARPAAAPTIADDGKS